MFFRLIITLLTIFPLLSFAHECPGIMPENDLWIGVGNKNTKEMTEVEFNQILDRVEAIYKPIVTAKKRKLEIVRKWKDGTVNAYAMKGLFGTWKVVMFGGMARHPETTKDSFAVVVCHEMGHHLGGTPIKEDAIGRMSVEGQADYWGGMKCLRKYMEKDDNAAIAAKLVVPEIVKTRCQNTYTNENDIGICYRTALAGMQLGKIFAAVKPQPGTVLDFGTPDTTVVKRTISDHPPYQCRVDTFFSAALCDKDADLETNEKDPDVGVCNKAEGYTQGLRPLCWYKPTT